MEDNSGGVENSGADVGQAEEFDCEEDEIMTNKDLASVLAKKKLKDLNDILQDYAGFDDVQLEDGNSDSTTEGKGQGPKDKETAQKDKVPTTDTEAGSSSIVSANLDDDLRPDPAPRESTVEQKYDIPQKEYDASNSNLNSNASLFERKTSVLVLPSGDSYDLTDSKCHHDIIDSCQNLSQDLTKSKEIISKYKQDVTTKHQRILELQEHAKNLQDRNQNLNGKLQSLLQELAKGQETLKAHDASARAAISRMQKESDQQIMSLKAKCSSMQKDKEAAVMNYARREKELLDAKRSAEAAEKGSKDASREKERAITQMRAMKIDLVKMKSGLEHQEGKNAQLNKEIEKWKEEANSHVIKVKWAQNKLKSETDLHNETKEKLAKAVLEIKHAKEETEQIRKNCQGMIKTYQESEEIRSNSLDSKLKEKEMLLSQQEAKSGELEGMHKQQMEELRRLKQQYKSVMEENIVIKTRVECLEKERVKNEETLKSYTELLNRQKKEASTMSEKLKELDRSRALLEDKEEEIRKTRDDLDDEKASNEEMRIYEKAWKKKEQELLEFTQRVSTKNAELTSGNEILSSKLETTTKDLKDNRTLSSALKEELKTLKTEMSTTSQNAEYKTSELNKRLEDKEATVNHLTIQLDELKDEIRTLKRKNNASIKDLTRQLQQARKRLEPYESASYPAGSAPTTEDGSMGSRASSDTSIDCVGKTNNAAILSHNSAAESGSLPSHSNGTDVPETVVASSGEISTQTLIERIVRLQRIHAKKNEKIDFLQDHVHQLVDEMQKKHKIIQHYILREESGMLMPITALNQANAAEHTGRMSRHLSEEVNRKMQSVLEDTLLKNIALKESVDALGSEIARISSTKHP